MKKGFFLSLASFIVLSFVLSSLSLKMLAVEESKESYVELVRLNTYAVSFSALNEEAVKEIVNNSAAYAVYTVAQYSAENPANNEQDLKQAIYEVFLYGANITPLFVGGPGIDVVEQNASLTRVIEKINDSIKSQGLEITRFEYPLPQFNKGWDISLEDYRTVKFNVEVNLTVEDTRKVSSINGTYDIEVYIDIEGMPDPLVNRYLIGKGFEPNRTIYFGESETFPSLSGPVASYDLTADEVGQGWAYGLTSSGNNFLGTFIAIGEFKDVRRLPASGYLINGTRELDTVQCPSGDEDEEDKTFNALRIISEGSSCRKELTYALLAPVDIDGDGLREGRGSFFVNLEEDKYNDILNPSSGTIEGKNLLFIVKDVAGEVVPAPSTTDPEDASAIKEDAEKLYIYDIEPQRNAVISGDYYRWDANYPEGDAPPNFFQRMIDPQHPDASGDADKGIFSFLITSEFKNGDEPISRIDYELAKGISDVLVVRGFPGCKDPAMCSLKPTDYDVGRFAMSREMARNLGLASISCEWNKAEEGCY